MLSLVFSWLFYLSLYLFWVCPSDSSVMLHPLPSPHSLFLLWLSLFFSSSSSSYSSSSLPSSPHASLLPNTDLRASPLSPSRRVHLLWAHAAWSAPTPDWQVLERSEGRRAGEVNWTDCDETHLGFPENPPPLVILPSHLESANGRMEGWRDGGRDERVWGEGVLVCGFACCVRVWS